MKTLILAAVLAATLATPAQAFDLKAKLGTLKGFSIKTVKVPVKTGKIAILAIKHLGLFAFGTAVIVKDQTSEGLHWTAYEFITQVRKLQLEAAGIPH